MRIIADLSSGLNLYPDLRLIDNVHEDYQASMDTIRDVLARIPLPGAADLILSLHRTPENNITGEETETAFERSVREICRAAAEKGITVHLRTGSKPPHNIPEAVKFIRRVGTANLKVAAPPSQAARELPDLQGLWLGANGGDAEFLKAAPGTIVLDGIYKDQDEEYRAIRALE